MIGYRPLDIFWIGPLFDISGIANVNRNIVLTMAKMGLKVRVINLDGWSRLSADISKQDMLTLRGMMETPIDPSNFSVIYCFPPNLVKQTDPKARARISFTLFETNKCPMRWIECLNSYSFDEVWVPANFLKTAFVESGIKKDKVKVVPMGIDIHRYNPGNKPLKVKGASGFKFLTVMDCSFRKAPGPLLKAYLEEFRNKEDVCLIFKAYNMDGSDFSRDKIRELIREAKKETGGTAPVIFVGHIMPDSLMPRMFRSGDIYVNVSRGEGWGLGELSSMASGLPQIMTKSSAHLDYGTDDNCLWVDCNEEEITNIDFLTDAPMFLKHKWWEPSIPFLRRQMRYAYENQEKIRILGFKARESAEKLSWENCVLKIVGRLAAYADRIEVK